MSQHIYEHKHFFESLFNISSRVKTFFKTFKNPRITQISETEEKNSVSKYKPILILQTFSKIFRKIIYQQLINNFK